MNNISYDNDRKFLQNILDGLNNNLSELENRVEIIKDNISYVEHAIQALKVFEHVTNPATSEVVNG